MTTTNDGEHLSKQNDKNILDELHTSLSTEQPQIVLNYGANSSNLPKIECTADGSSENSDNQRTREDDARTILNSTEQVIDQPTTTTRSDQENNQKHENDSTAAPPSNSEENQFDRINSSTISSSNLLTDHEKPQTTNSEDNPLDGINSSTVSTSNLTTEHEETLTTAASTDKHTETSSPPRKSVRLAEKNQSSGVNSIKESSTHPINPNISIDNPSKKKIPVASILQTNQL